MQVLEAVRAEEVHEEQIRGVAVQHVRRDVGHHVVPEKAFRELRPLAEAIDRHRELMVTLAREVLAVADALKIQPLGFDGFEPETIARGKDPDP